MECTSESLGAVLRAFCPCGLVRQALNYILRGVRIGADRVKITLFLRGVERVHVPTVIDLRAFSFCEVLQKLGRFAKLAIFCVVTGLPSLHLGASGSFCLCCFCCCLRMAACCMQAHCAPEIAPETAAALPSCFSPGES